ncbi:hypothetical protein COO60DRAFT_1549265 [Scenedesmus sp. NREL 46B-D3]|nr:hypothetical protein COO60DRAFT_1549265 [Scenedesmus sp. NREL 46B-D3]
MWCQGRRSGATCCWVTAGALCVVCWWRATSTPTCMASQRHSSSTVSSRSLTWSYLLAAGYLAHACCRPAAVARPAVVQAQQHKAAVLQCACCC